MSLYRKYRPQNFENLLAQDVIINILRRSAADNKLSHAYLFAGPRGTGKTTTARLLSKVANCEKRLTDPVFYKTGEPCNECPSCLEVSENRSFDVIEIDAASNRGIDEIRNLKNSVRVAPVRLNKKIFIIDEVHMLTKEAWNALLKTLEEPPENIIFILATTESEKIPPTIASRVQQFHFRRIPREKITEKLNRIAAEEKIKIEPEALDLIAWSAEGGMRDAESILERFIAIGSDKITVAEVERTLGKIGFTRISELCEAMLQRKLSLALDKISEINEEGHNLSQITKDIIQHLRRVAVIKHNPGMTSRLESEMSPEQVKILTTQTKLWQDSSLTLLKYLIEAYGEMRYSQFPVIPLEIAMIESLR